MEFGIAGKVALVAGGSKGMGRATAVLLAAEGCRVGLVAHDRVSLDGAVADIIASGGAAIGISADIGEPDGVRAAVGELQRHWGLPDIVVGQMSNSTHGASCRSRPRSTKTRSAPSPSRRGGWSGRQSVQCSSAAGAGTSTSGDERQGAHSLASAYGL